MLRSIILGLGLAGLAYWLRQRATPAPVAHNLDGSDASAAFRAGIADENMVPDRA